MILGKDEIVKKITSSYINNILVDETTATAEEVISHLNKFGLAAKHQELLEDGAALRL